MYEDKASKIKSVIADYFNGIFYGDIHKLKAAFSSNVYFYGDVKGSEYLKSLDDYLEGVKNRKSPNELNEENKMEVLSLEILGEVAIAKLHVPMLGYNYYDFLSLSVIGGEWKIVNKLFTHVE